MTTYEMPLAVDVPENRSDVAANIAFFLLKNTGSTKGDWYGKMKAEDQRRMFGAVLGRGKVWMNGLNETVEHNVKVCFGTDSQLTMLAYLKTGEFHWNPDRNPEEGEKLRKIMGR